ncbi:hypothetical protein ACHAWT_010691 [Skeletonema menzelii]
MLHRHRISLLITATRIIVSNPLQFTSAYTKLPSTTMTRRLNTTKSVARTALDEMSTDGSFKRVDAAWRNKISKEPGSMFPPEKGRYHLYVAYACPWAHRTLMTRAIKGLEDIISVTVVMPVWQKTKPDDPIDRHNGWVFANKSGEALKNTAGLGGPFPASYPSNEADPIFNAKSVREIYEISGDKDGKYTVPILFDKKSQTIVSNESSEIIQMLNSQFDEYATSPDIDLEPQDLREAMQSVDSWIYPNLNNGVYRCGFAKTQEAYNLAIDDLTAAFDRVEEILSRQRFIAGDQFTLSDIRLFVTLLRFDEVYVVYFKTNTRSVANSPNLLNYCREIYQIPGVAETVDMHQIKEHYFCSHPDLNKLSIVPRGPDFERMLNERHNRGALGKRPKISVSDEEKD